MFLVLMDYENLILYEIALLYGFNLEKSWWVAENIAYISFTDQNI